MDITCYIANLMILGIEMTTCDDGSQVRNKIPLHVADYEMELLQEKDLINEDKNKLKGHFIESTKIIVKNVNEGEIEKIVLTIGQLATMLSFATDSQVRLYKWASSDGFKGKCWSVIGSFSHFRPPFCTVNTKELKKFIETCWNSYNKLENPRALKAVVELFVSTDSLRLPLELKLATSFILLENLKSTYAKHMDYQYKKGFYRKSDGSLWSFQSLLNEMFNSVGMTVDLVNIKTLRDEIIHSGLSQLSSGDQYKIYEKCKELVTEYFLRLIGFSGKYFLYSSRGTKFKQIV